MPEEARIFLAEDDELNRNMFKLALEKDGHRVLLIAETLEEGLSLIPEAVEHQINLGVFDDRMPNKDDGKKLTEVIREAIPGIKIVSTSTGDVDYADIHTGKLPLSSILRAVKSL